MSFNKLSQKILAAACCGLCCMAYCPVPTIDAPVPSRNGVGTDMPSRRPDATNLGRLFKIIIIITYFYSLSACSVTHSVTIWVDFGISRACAVHCCPYLDVYALLRTKYCAKYCRILLIAAVNDHPNIALTSWHQLMMLRGEWTLSMLDAVDARHAPQPQAYVWETYLKFKQDHLFETFLTKLYKDIFTM